nr:unnamed protein product [Spirometra erinaceieuropaei]
MTSVKSSTSVRRQATQSSAAASGMVDEEAFRQAFKSVSSLPIYSSKDMAEYIKKVKDSLSVNAEDWERRVDALQTLRSVVAGGSHQMEDFYTQLRTLEQPVEACLRDLRSQVVRESCVTVAYLSQELGIRFDHFAEVIMPTLLNLIPNSAKIMSTSGIQAVMFIIKNTHAARLLPIIVGGLSSKSNVVRRYVCEFLDPICQYWPVNVIDRYMGLFQEALRKGISDADQDARSASRRAFQSFAMKFPDESRALLQNLEPAQRRSVPTYRRHSSRTVSRYSVPRSVQGINDIITLLRSPQWAEKKDGLVNLQNFLRSGEQLSQPEVNRLADVLSSIFGDSSSKVLSLFMDTLQLFMKTYHLLLHDWVYVALVRLLSRQGHEVLSSHQRAIKETLTVLRSTFPLDLQFFHCCRFVIDDALTPAPKVKVCMLEYIKDLLVMMPMDALNSPPVEVVKAITRIITWSTEPKSAEVRRLSSRVIIKMSDLNPDNFSHLIQQIPRSQQEQASKLLKTYQKTSTAGGSALASDGGSFAATATPGPASTAASNWFTKSGVRRAFSMRQPKAKAPASSQAPSGRSFNPITPKYVQQQAACPPGDSYQSRGLRAGSIPDGQLHDAGAGHFTSSHFSSQHMQQPQYHPGGNTNGSGANNGHNHFPMVAPSPLYSPPTHLSTPGSPTNSQQMRLQSAEGGFFNERSPLSQPGYDQQDNSPASRTSRPPSLLSGFDRANELTISKIKKPVIGYQTLKKIREMLPEDALTEILQELSNYNERYEQRKACMLKLIKLLRDGSVETWEEHSKPTLLILLESLSDNSGDTRALALRVLQELVRTQGELIREYACLTVMKILEACKDSEKAVVRSAEECAQTVARYLPQELCLRLLTTVILDTRTELNLPAVKMQTQVIKVSSPEAVAEVLPDLIPGLISACSHEDSAVRKASIFCLVQLALKFGDNIWPHLEELAASKKRLLRVYIDKELQGNISSESLRIG